MRICYVRDAMVLIPEQHPNRATVAQLLPVLSKHTGVQGTLHSSILTEPCEM